MTVLQEILHKLYEDMNSLLRFAEAKNVGLITFNAAIIVGMTKLLYDFRDSPFHLYLFTYIMICSVIAIAVSFMSTMPQIKHKASEMPTFNSDNLLFFGKIACMKPDVYLTEFCTRYGKQSDDIVYDTDLCRQIVIVSQIAYRKMRYFKVACYITLFIFTPLAPIIYKLVLDHNK